MYMCIVKVVDLDPESSFWGYLLEPQVTKTFITKIYLSKGTKETGTTKETGYQNQTETSCSNMHVVFIRLDKLMSELNKCLNFFIV